MNSPTVTTIALLISLSFLGGAFAVSTQDPGPPPPPNRGPGMDDRMALSLNYQVEPAA